MTAGPFLPETIWQADENKFVAEEFGDTALVYHRPSGDTHFLSFLPVDALKFIVQRSADCNAIHQHLLEIYEFDEQDLPFQLVKDAIGQLDETGLITPAVSVGKPLTGTN